MASKSPLQRARKLFRARKYPKVISLLEPLVLEYKESFDFFFLLGTACLYLEDIGGAEAYYKSARRLKPVNTDIMKAQGVLYLRLGDVTRALELFLGVLDSSPGDAVATEALDFIRRNSNPEKMEEKIRGGALRRFYPKRGLHPAVIPSCLALCLLCACAAFFFANYKVILGLNGARADLSYLELTEDDKKNLVSENLGNGYILTTEDVEKTYKEATRFFQQNRDNEARRCVNKLMNSNAGTSIKVKAQQLAERLEEPLFGSVTDNFPVKQVLEDIVLYENCWVEWAGRVSNIEMDDKFLKCVFLVGYEKLDKIDGTVTLVLEQPVSLNPEKPVKVLARITLSEGQLILRGKTIYQPVKDSDL